MINPLNLFLVAGTAMLSLAALPPLAAQVQQQVGSTTTTTTTTTTGGTTTGGQTTGGGTTIAYALTNPGLQAPAGPVEAGAEHMTFAFGVRQTSGSGGRLTQVTVNNQGTAQPADWLSMRLIHNGNLLATATSQTFPVTFSGFSELLTGVIKNFEVLVTVAPTAYNSSTFALSLAGSGLQFTPAPSSSVTGTINGNTMTVMGGNDFSEVAIHAQPSGGAGGTALPAQPVIHLMDPDGLVAAYDNTTVVSAYLVEDTGNPYGQIVSGHTAQALAGVATFNDLAIDRVGQGYRLFFIAGGIASDESEPFDIELGPAHALRMLVQPSEAVRGFAFGIQPRVEIVDAGGNPFLYDNTTAITAALKEGAGPAAALSGNATAVVEGGVAEWQDLAIHAVGSGYQLEFTAEGLELATSATFQVASPISTSKFASGGGCSSNGMPVSLGLLLMLAAVAAARASGVRARAPRR